MRSPTTGILEDAHVLCPSDPEGLDGEDAITFLSRAMRRAADRFGGEEAIVAAVAVVATFAIQSGRAPLCARIFQANAELLGERRQRLADGQTQRRTRP